MAKDKITMKEFIDRLLPWGIRYTRPHWEREGFRLWFARVVLLRLLPEHMAAKARAGMCTPRPWLQRLRQK